MSTRRLAAIMFTDIVGYTAMMQRDETDGLLRVKHFKQVMTEEVESNEGEVLQFMGDGCLCIFQSAVKALYAAQNIHKRLKTAPTVPLRIGIHIGDIVIQQGNIYGDGVNVASRVESMGVPGSILLSERVLEVVKSHPEFEMVSLGQFAFKNVQKPMEIFALANEGLIVPRKAEMKGKGKATTGSFKPLFRGIVLGLLGILIGGLIWSNISWKEGGAGFEDEINAKSIAILPFENLSQDKLKAHLSDGISQDILTNLSGIQDLQVISFNASKRYRNSAKSSHEIGQALGAKHLLNGSVQQAGEQLLIRVMLIDSETDRQLWAKRYDNTLEDIFQIQAEVAYEIAEILKAELLPATAARISAKPTQNILAWQEYSQGRYQWGLRTDESLAQAEQHFFKAIALDTAFALAYAGLAQVYQVFGTNPDLEAAFYFPKSKTFAEKALSFNHDIADAYAVLGGYYCWHEIDYPRSVAMFKTAVSLEPGNETAHQWFAESLLNQGDVSGARVEVEIAKRLDPGSLIIRFVEATVLLGEDRYAEAKQLLEKLHEEHPEVGSIRWFLAETYLYLGQLEKSISVPGLDTNKEGLPYSYLLETHQIGALQKWNEQHPGTGWYPYRTENDIYLLSGDTKRYIARMDSAFFVHRFMDPGTFQYYPPPDSVLAHPDFQALMRKGHFRVRPRSEELKEGLEKLRQMALIAPHAAK